MTIASSVLDRLRTNRAFQLRCRAIHLTRMGAPDDDRQVACNCRGLLSAELVELRSWIKSPRG